MLFEEESLLPVSAMQNPGGSCSWVQFMFAFPLLYFKRKFYFSWKITMTSEQRITSLEPQYCYLVFSIIFTSAAGSFTSSTRQYRMNRGCLKLLGQFCFSQRKAGVMRVESHFGSLWGSLLDVAVPWCRRQPQGAVGRSRMALGNEPTFTPLSTAPWALFFTCLWC